MYRAAIRDRALDGIRTHGTLRAYLADFRACSKVFEMFVAERMAIERGVQFWLWEDVPHEIKTARGLARRDLGIDVTDGATTIVQCKLRARYITWGECSTFFACAVAYTDGAYAVPWRDLVLARNACSKLSPNFASMAATRPFDAPIGMGEFGAFVAGTLVPLDGAAPGRVVGAAEAARAARAAPVESLRDYQRDAIELCCADAGPAYVVLPTGTGKSVVIAHVAMRVEGRVLVLVPLVVLLEQLVGVLSRHGCIGVAAVGHNDEDHTLARVVVCVFNSAHKLDLGAFERILVDEAHFIARPAVYSDLEGPASQGIESLEGHESQGHESESHGGIESLSGYAAVRAAMAMRSARLFSATIDVPGGAPQCTRSLRAMIDAGYLSDYTLHVPVFEAGATNEDLAAHLVRTCRSMLVFCATRAEGTVFCAALNARGACAKYIDCDTPRAERRETVRQFKSGSLAFVVNVRVLSVGFDAPITRGVCFAHMPASQTQAIQVIGRCLRTHPDKHMAHVVLPVVTGEDGADVRVRDFMRVLAQSDARFADSLRARGSAFVDVQLAGAEPEAGSEADETVETVVAVERTEAALLFERIYDSMGRALFGAWDTRLAELVAYHAEHARIPTLREPLGHWVNTQRTSRHTMPLERKAKLDALPWWEWVVRERAEWDTRLEELKTYHAEHGRIPSQATIGGLGSWVATQRRARHTMSVERKEKLDALPWWKWVVLDPGAREAEWDARLAELEAYHAEHSRVPAESAGPLGEWVLVQHRGRETMSFERKSKLDALPWWKWRSITWDTRLAALAAYHAEHGTVPPETDLGVWTAAQRGKRETMREDHRAKLDALPWWTWSEHCAEPSLGHQSRWDSRLAELVAYTGAEHGMMPLKTTPLGGWVYEQQTSRETMRADRREKLDALPCWSWLAKEVTADRWGVSLAELVVYHGKHGSLPPRSTALGIWVDSQRRSSGTSKLTRERRERLDALPWWTYQVPRVDEASVWDARYRELIAYHSEHRSLPPLGTPLGRWVYVQQQTRAALGSERVALLEELAFWKWHSDRSDALWTAVYDELVAAHADTGCAPLPKTKLGKWAATQKRERETMAPYRRAKLDALTWLGCLPDERREAAEALVPGWQERLTELVAYHAENGAMPRPGTPLGRWANTQRLKRGTMAEEHKAQLSALSWWRWDNSDRWDARFAELVAYHAENARVPSQDNISELGNWVGTQRQKRETMPLEHKEKLEALPWWTWPGNRKYALTSAWDARFTELVAYHAEHARCPPQGTPLGNWVISQRRNREKMAVERKAKLAALPWWKWGAPAPREVPLRN